MTFTRRIAAASSSQHSQTQSGTKLLVRAQLQTLPQLQAHRKQEWMGRKEANLLPCLNPKP